MGKDQGDVIVIPQHFEAKSYRHKTWTGYKKKALFELIDEREYSFVL